MADAHEALGQNMEEPAADEFGRRKCFAFERVVGAVAVAKNDVSAKIKAFETILMEGGLFDISGEVAQGGASASGVLALGDPIGVPDSGGYAGEKIGMVICQERTEGVAGGAGEGLVGNKIVFVTRMVEKGAGVTKSHGGNEGVDVGMKEHAPRPGVENADKGGLSAKIFGRGAESLEGMSLGGEKGGEKLGREKAESRTKPGGDGDGEQIIRNGQEAGLLTTAPERGITSAAAGTGAVVAAMEKKMTALAGGAMVQASATPRCAATQNSLDGGPGAGRDGTFRGPHISAPVLAQDLREVQGHLVFELVVEETLLDLASAAFADLGDVEINKGRVEVGMAKVGADLANGNAVLEQMRGETVPQSMTGGVLLDAAGGQDHAQGVLDGGHTHGVTGLAHGDGKTTGALLPSATNTGKEPMGVAMEAPIFTQLGDHDRADGHLAHLSALAVDDAQDAAGGVNVGRFDGDGLADPQTAVVDERENGQETPAADGAQDLPQLGTGQDDRQRLITPDGELFPEHPLETGKIAKKHPQSHHGLVERGGTQLFDIPKMNEVIKDLSFLYPAKFAPGVMGGKFAHLTKILGFAASPESF